MVVATMLSTMSVHAQDYKHNEISAAYGFGSNTDLITSLFKGAFTGKQLDYWGPVSLEYFYRPSEKFGVGAIAAVGGCKWDDSDDAKSTFFTIMPAMKYNWLNKSHFSMYSKLGLGLTVGDFKGSKDKTNDTSFNWQCTLVGMDFGGDFRGFVELGFGEQGILLGGLRFKF